MNGATSKLFKLLRAAKKANIIISFKMESSFESIGDYESEVVKVSYRDAQDSDREFSSVNNRSIPIEESESEASAMLSSVMHALYAHGSAWLPESLKDPIPQEKS